MNLRRNVAIAIANSVCTAVLTLLAIPFYLRYLGMESYGLVGFYATTQALLQLLDAGLGPGVNREMAQASASGGIERARNLLLTLARVYWLVALAIAATLLLASPAIAQHWLNARELAPETLRNAVALMGLVIACRWPSGLYQAAVLGMHRVATSSTINMLAVLASTAGAILVLAFVSATIEAFFAWQAIVALGQALAMRAAAWHYVGREGAGSFDLRAVARIWRFSAGMGGIAVASVLLVQMDKVLLSRMLTLESFAHYALAAVLASGLYVLLTPVFNVVFPRMSSMVARGEGAALLEFHKTGTRLLASFLFPIAIAFACAAPDLVRLWTGDAAIAARVGPLVSLLVLGTSLNGIMHFPYALQLAHGRSSLALTITVLLAICLLPLIVLLTSRYGAIGSAAAWLTLNVIYLLFGTWMTHRVLYPGAATGWLLHDVLVPLLVSALLVVAGWRLFSSTGHALRDALLACALVPLAVAANLALLPRSVLASIRGGRLGAGEPPQSA